MGIGNKVFLAVEHDAKAGTANFNPLFTKTSLKMSLN